MGRSDDMVGKVAVYKLTDIHSLVMSAAGSKHEYKEQHICENYNNSKNKRYYPFHGKSPTPIVYSVILFFRIGAMIINRTVPSCRLCHLL